MHERARVAAERYRAAHCAKLVLAGVGDWEDVLRTLEDGDIRGYQDVEKLHTCVGHPGTLEDGQLAEAELCAEEEETGTSSDNDDVASINSAGINLMGKKWHKRDGTGQTQRALSWIWMSGT